MTKKAKLYRVNYEETVFFETFIEAISEYDAKAQFRHMMERAEEEEDILEPTEVAMGEIDVEVVD